MSPGAAPPPPLPAALVDWLGQLVLLGSVPFDHLVADDDLLPSESVRFFTVDRNWQAALLDGAFSIGRLGSAYTALDRATLVPATGPGLLDLALGAAGVSAAVCSGFLMRSEAVSGWWPGLRVDAYAQGASGDQTLPVLRLKRLAPTLLFGLFDGVLAQVVVHEPPQGVHFGLDTRKAPTDPLLHRTLRHLAPAPGAPAGTALPDSDPNASFVVEQQAGDLTFLRNNRVVKVNRLAMGEAPGPVGMRRHLIEAGALAEGDPFTSAEVALELVEGVDLVTFVADPPA